MQTSCGWGLQPAPALALAFLQVDVDARHCEVVRALVRLNKVPARHAASQGCPGSPSSLRCAKASARHSHGLQAEGTQLAPIPRQTWQSRVETLKCGHAEDMVGPFPGRSVLLGSLCPLPLDIPPKSTQAGLALSPRPLEQAGGELWARRHWDFLPCKSPDRAKATQPRGISAAWCEGDSPVQKGAFPAQTHQLGLAPAPALHSQLPCPSVG